MTGISRKLLASLRGLRHCRGHGIHSPFVFHLVSRVIEERCRYYYFDYIDLLYKKYAYSDRAKAALIQQRSIKRRDGELLFRLANHFKPTRILQIGATTGISTLYLTSYSTTVRCLSLESDPTLAELAKELYTKAENSTIEQCVGSYRETLPRALERLREIDFIFFDLHSEQNSIGQLFIECLKHIHPETVCVINHIHSGKTMRDAWKELQQQPQVSVTIETTSVGIVFFNNKWHKRNYRIC